MHLILCAKNIEAICEKPIYVRQLGNGLICRCEKAEATAVYVEETDKVYRLIPAFPGDKALRLKEVENAPGEVLPGWSYDEITGEFESPQPTFEERTAALEEALLTMMTEVK